MSWQVSTQITILNMNSPCFTRSLKPRNCYMHAKNLQCQMKDVAHNVHTGLSQVYFIGPVWRQLVSHKSRHQQKYTAPNKECDMWCPNKIHRNLITGVAYLQNNIIQVLLTSGWTEARCWTTKSATGSIWKSAQIYWDEFVGISYSSKYSKNCQKICGDYIHRSLPCQFKVLILGIQMWCLSERSIFTCAWTTSMVTLNCNHFSRNLCVHVLCIFLQLLNFLKPFQSVQPTPVSAG